MRLVAQPGAPVLNITLSVGFGSAESFARARLRGTVAGAWMRLLRDWLPSSGMQLDSRPFFEYYPIDSMYDPETGVFECDLCIPVVALLKRRMCPPPVPGLVRASHDPIFRISGSRKP